MNRNAIQIWVYFTKRFHLSGVVWLMNEQMNKWIKRLNLVIATTKPNLIRLCRQSDRLYNKMAIPTANRLSHERSNNANIIISSKNYAISTVLWILSHLAQWHSGTMSWPSGHLGTSGNLRDIQGSSVTSGKTLWHAGTLLACWHTCCHSRQTHGIQTNDEHHPLNLVDFRLQAAIVVGLWFQGLWWHLYIWGKAQKLPQPQKLKNMVKQLKPGPWIGPQFDRNKPNKPNKLNNQFDVKVQFFYQNYQIWSKT